MANEENSASGKVIKERTVKKRAARSIVAPKADEEITGRDARRREAFAAMNKKQQPVTERESKVIKTPGGLKTKEETGKGVKMVTAPIQLMWNEDTLDPSLKTPKKIQATGWPEKPPAPAVPVKEKSRAQQQAQSQPQTGNMQPLPRIPETVEALKEMTGPLPDIEEELKRSAPSKQRSTPEAVRDTQSGALQVRPMKEGPQKGMQDAQRTVASRPDPARKGMPAPGQQRAQNIQPPSQPGQQQVRNIQSPSQPGQEEPVQNGPKEQPQTVGSYGQPHSDMSDLSSVRESNAGNTTVWNPVESQEERRRGNNEVSVPMSMRGTDGVNKETAVTTRIDRDAVNSEESRGGRRILKTVVTTTTTTTYETVNDDDLREISTPPADTGTGTGTVPPAPVRRNAGQPPRRGQRPGQQPLQQNMRQRANGPGGPYGQRTGMQSRRPGQNTRPMQQGMQGQGMGGAQQGRPAPRNSMQPGQQQGAQGSMIDRMMSQPAASHKPMSAMDKQLADIEKALGLTGDMNPAENTAPVNGGISPAGIRDPGNHDPLMPDIPGSSAPGAGGPGALAGPDANGSQGANGSNGPSDKPPLNEDVFKGIGTFSKGPNVTINEREVPKNKSAEYTMLAIEGVIFVIILCVCMSIYSKIRRGDVRTDIEKAPTQETETGHDDNDMTMDTGSDGLEVQEAGSDDEILADTGSETGADDITLTSPSDSVDVENDNFSLRCTNVTVVLDANNNPAALIYFTFVNKTSKLLSMSEVFPPSVTQNGEPCETFASLNEYPEEFYNKDTQVSDGTSIDCCYSVSLKDAVSPLSLTIHDNYETFKDVGTTEIPLQ